MSNNITIDDIAREAGVSVSTVSRILNNKPDVALSTRTRVMDVIDQLGYVPHGQAQGLAGGRGRTIALHYPTRMSEFSQIELDFFVGAANAADKHGYFFSFITRPLTKDGLVNLYRGAKVDGVVLMQIRTDDWRVNLLRDLGYPSVMLGRVEDSTHLNFVDLDFQGAIEDATNYIVSLGHKNIALINFGDDIADGNFGPTIRTQRGFNAAKESLSVITVERQAELSIDAMYDTTRNIIETNPDVTAIVTSQGSTAIGVIRALADVGLRVPEDCSVVAIVNDKTANLITPPLTAIRFPTYKMGFEAVSILIKRLRHPETDPVQLLLKSELIIRQSTGAAPGS